MDIAIAESCAALLALLEAIAERKDCRTTASAARYPSLMLMMQRSSRLRSTQHVSIKHLAGDMLARGGSLGGSGKILGEPGL